MGTSDLSLPSKLQVPKKGQFVLSDERAEKLRQNLSEMLDTCAAASTMPKTLRRSNSDVAIRPSSAPAGPRKPRSQALPASETSSRPSSQGQKATPMRGNLKSGFAKADGARQRVSFCSEGDAWGSAAQVESAG